MGRLVVQAALEAAPHDRSGRGKRGNYCKGLLLDILAGETYTRDVGEQDRGEGKEDYPETHAREDITD